MTALTEHIQNSLLADTHEHQPQEAELLQNYPDVVQELIIPHYLTADLLSAGAPPAAVARTQNGADPDLAGRFEGVRKEWEACRNTGYGEASRLIAKLVYGMDEVTPAGLETAQKRNLEMRRPGERLRLFKDVAKVAYIHADRGGLPCPPDPSAPDFHFSDLSWWAFARGEVPARQVSEFTGVEIKDMKSLRTAMEAIFDRSARRAIAVKTQHAYTRTLSWTERADAETEPALQKVLAGAPLSDPERLCLGDWNLARAAELAAQYNLPFKFHTGYCSRNYEMVSGNIRPGNLCPLFMKYRQTRFVLFHMSYPYQNELVSLAKHFPNVYGDLCWAWGVDPFSAGDFVRRWLHAAPANKLFGFGGDTFYPSATVAFAAQARKWLGRALQAEVDDGLMTERQAIAFATRIMTQNQAEFFDLEGKRAAMRETLSA